MTPETLSVIVLKEGNYLVAQVLEFDMATQASNWEDLQYEIQRILAAHVSASQERGLTPFPAQPAPQCYKDQYDTAMYTQGYTVSKFDSLIPMLLIRTDLKL